jgi:hypothetical protein
LLLAGGPSGCSDVVDEHRLGRRRMDGFWLSAPDMRLARSERTAMYWTLWLWLDGRLPGSLLRPLELARLPALLLARLLPPEFARELPRERLLSVPGSCAARCAAPRNSAAAAAATAALLLGLGDFPPALGPLAGGRGW